MSSVAWNDKSCMEYASAMSCSAMSELAYQDWDRNTGTLSYQVVQPTVCERSQNLADRDEEAYLLYGGGLSRKLCFTHDPSLKAGSYFKQIENRRTEDFDSWTRRKDISKPYEVIDTRKEPSYDLDYAFFAPECLSKKQTCFLNSGVDIGKTIPCPDRCGIHPTPCPNPISRS